MDEASQAGLKAQGSVCDPCFRALTARGTELAVKRKIPVVMTGLSRGQICATKLHNLISNGVTDPDEIETYLRMFRESYHATEDRISELIDDRSLDDRAAFDGIQF